MENELENIEQIDETAAADSLKPMGAPGESKAVMLSTFTQMLSQLGIEDLSNIFNQVQAQFGPNTPNAADNSAQNKSTIKSDGAMPAMPMPVLGVKEDVEEMFAGDELTEEFKERAEVIFEAAVNTRVALERTRLEEEFEAQMVEMAEQTDALLEEKSAEIFEELGEKLDQYLDYAVSTWMEENQLAIDNGLRAEIAEDFIKGLHGLFKEHYITVPESEVDLMAEMKERLDSLEAALNEQIDENLELKSIVNESTKASIVDEMVEGLSMSQAEKLRSLCEGIEFTDSETFARRASILKENYFPAVKSTPGTGMILEEAEPNDGTETEYVSEEMNAYLAATIKSFKK